MIINPKIMVVRKPIKNGGWTSRVVSARSVRHGGLDAGLKKGVCENRGTNWTETKRQALLSIESWLFNDRILIRLHYNPYIYIYIYSWVGSHPQEYPKQPGALFSLLRCFSAKKTSQSLVWFLPDSKHVH